MLLNHRGTIIEPGEGEYIFDNGAIIVLRAQADPGFVFTGFSGTYVTRENPALLTVDQSHQIQVSCLIVGNRATDPDGAIVYCTQSNALFINCTMAGNLAGKRGAGLLLIDSHVTMANSILWGNSPTEILCVGTGEVSIRYSDILGIWPGEGNLVVDPLFAVAGRWVDGNNPTVAAKPDDPGAVWVMGNYHLQSQTGRWDPKTGSWRQDERTSPCIDAGDPDTPVAQEPFPNGGIISLGAYGGTTQASKSDTGVGFP
jgi:hypothetical protein